MDFDAALSDDNENEHESAGSGSGPDSWEIPETSAIAEPETKSPEPGIPDIQRSVAAVVPPPPKTVYVSRVAGTLDNVVCRHPVVGEYMLDRDWDSYAIVTANWAAEPLIYLMEITVPGGAVVSVSYDRKRLFGRKFRTRVTAAYIKSICDVTGPIAIPCTSVAVKRRVLSTGNKYEFDLLRDTLFVTPDLVQAHRLITFLRRYNPEPQDTRVVRFTGVTLEL